MKIIITKSDWGMDDIPTTPERMEAVKDAGFDGFEAFFPPRSPVKRPHQGAFRAHNRR